MKEKEGELTAATLKVASLESKLEQQDSELEKEELQELKKLVVNGDLSALLEKLNEVIVAR